MIVQVSKQIQKSKDKQYPALVEMTMPSARFILIWCYDPVLKTSVLLLIRLYGEKFVADKNNTNSNKDMGEWASESLIVSKVRNTRKRGEGEENVCLGRL